MLLPDDETVLNTKFRVVILKTAACRFWTPPDRQTPPPDILTCMLPHRKSHHITLSSNDCIRALRARLNLLRMQIHYQNRFAIWKNRIRIFLEKTKNVFTTHQEEHVFQFLGLQVYWCGLGESQTDDDRYVIQIAKRFWQ